MSWTPCASGTLRLDERVLEQDQRIPSMRMALNERVMRMIATQHPVAVDLRRLFYIIHLADEMERIGYQAAAIAAASCARSMERCCCSRTSTA